MGRYRIIESVGSRVEQVHSYEDLEIHHPSQHGHERGRTYAEVEGRREEVLRSRSSEGNLMVSKDFVLTDEHGATRVPVPSPAAGYIGRVDARAGLLAIYDHAGGELIAQVRHMDLAGSGLHVGQTVAYGQPLGMQSGFGGGNPHAYGTHTHIDFNTSRLDDFKQYFADIDGGAIEVVRNRPAHANAAAAVGRDHGAPLRKAEIEAAQQALSNLGYTGADGRALVIDGIAGRNSRHAVEQFQRDHHVSRTGILDASTTARIAAADRTMASSTHPAHSLYRESLGAVADLDRRLGVPPGAHSLALAGAVAAEAARSGLAHVHRVEMGKDGVHAQAVEFRHGIDNWVTNRTSAPLDVPGSLGQSLEVSSLQASDAMAARHKVHAPAPREHVPMRAPVL